MATNGRNPYLLVFIITNSQKQRKQDPLLLWFKNNILNTLKHYFVINGKMIRRML